MKILFLFFTLIYLMSYPAFSYLHLGGIETESHIILSKDMVLWNAGFMFLNDIEYNEEKFDVIRVPVTLKYGLTNKVELQGGVIFNSQSSDFNNSPRGVESIYLGSRFRLNQMLSAKIYMNISGNRKLYYGIDEISIGSEIQTGIKLLQGSLSINGGYISRSGKFLIENPYPLSPDTKEYENHIYYSAVYNYPVFRELNFFVEYVDFGQSIEDSYKNIYANAGIKYEIADDVELIFYGTKGFEPGAPDLGVSFMFNKYFGYSYYSASGIDIRQHQPDHSQPAERVPLIVQSDEKVLRAAQAFEESFIKSLPHGGEDDIVLSSILDKIRQLELMVEPKEATKKPEKDEQRQKPELLYCNNCGEQIPPDSLFCPFCGQSLDDSKVKHSHIPDDAQVSVENYALFSASMEKGRADFSKNRYDRAIHHFRQALKIIPTSVEALYNIGVAHFYAREYKESRQFFEQAIALAPNDVDSLNFLAWIYHIQGDIKLAIETYKKTLEIDPDNPVAKANLERLGIY